MPGMGERHNLLVVRDLGWRGMLAPIVIRR
jgi:hypothetical protein